MPISADQWRAVVGSNSVRRPRQQIDSKEQLRLLRYHNNGDCTTLGGSKDVTESLIQPETYCTPEDYDCSTQSANEKTVVHVLVLTVCQVLQFFVSMVTLSLLILSGDVETNPGPTGKGTPEYRTIVACTATIKNNLAQGASGISDTLFSKGVISDETRYAITHASTGRDKADILLQAVTDGIAANSEVFREFVSAVKNSGSWTDDMVKYIMGEYEKEKRKVQKPKPSAGRRRPDVNEDIDSIARHHGLTPDQLDVPCAMGHLLPISKLIANWKAYAWYLGLSDQEEKYIQGDISLTSPHQRPEEMLKMWQKKTSDTPHCHYRRLLRACIEIETNRLLAGQICDVIKEMPPIDPVTSPTTVALQETSTPQQQVNVTEPIDPETPPTTSRNIIPQQESSAPRKDVTETGKPTILDSSHIHTLREALWELRVRWSDIGSCLRVSQASLQEVRHNLHLRDDGQRLGEVLISWIGSGKAIIHDLLKALRSKIIRRVDIANQICARRGEQRTELGMCTTRCEVCNPDGPDVPVTAVAAATNPKLDLEMLLQKEGLTENKLNKQLEADDLLDLAGLFDNVELYVDKFQLLPGDKMDVRTKTMISGHLLAMHHALERWKGRNPFNATFKTLLLIVLELGKGEIAINICDYFKRKYIPHQAVCELSPSLENSDEQDSGATVQYVTDKYWPKDVLHIFFMNPEMLSELGLKPINIMTWAEIWNRHSSCKDLIPRFNHTTDQSISDIRIKIVPNGHSWSKVGTDAESVDKSKPTMVLGLVPGNNEYNKHTTIHEFGHTLGLEHEHQRSKFWSVAKKFLVIGRMKELQEMDVMSEYYEKLQMEKGHYDPDSIMHFWFNKRWIEEPKYQNEENVRDDTSLSEEERKVLLGIHKRHLSLADKPSEMDYQYLAKCYQDLATKLRLRLPEPSSSSSIKIGIIGSTNSGKSTTLNALLQGKFLPSSSGGTTAHVLCIKHDTTTPEGKLYNLADDPQTPIAVGEKNIFKRLDALNQAVRQHPLQGATNVDGKIKLELRVKMPFLREQTNLELYDTPGISEAKDSPIFEAAISKQEEMDGHILVLSQDTVKVKKPAELLSSLQEQLPTLAKQDGYVPLVNKYDLFFLEGGDQDAEKKKQEIAGGIGISLDLLVFYSAKLALQARLCQDLPQLVDEDRYEELKVAAKKIPEIKNEVKAIRGKDIKGLSDIAERGSYIHEVESVILRYVRLLKSPDSKLPLQALGTMTQDNQDLQMIYLQRLHELMRDGHTFDLQYIKMYLVGTAGIGKTTTKKRMIGAILDLVSLSPEERKRCSTHLAECTTALVVAKDSNPFHRVSDDNLDEEAQLLFAYLFGSKISETKPNTPTSESSSSAVSDQVPETSLNDGVPKDKNTQPTEEDTGLTRPPVEHPTEGVDESSKVQHKPASINSTVDVNQVITRLRSIVGSGTYAEELLGKLLLNLVDVGGQPYFLEMIPFLNRGPGMFLAFFPLDKALTEYYEVSYERGKNKITSNKPTYTTNQQALSQILSSVCHHMPFDNKELTDKVGGLSKVRPVVTLVGTFKDKLETQVTAELLQEKLADKFPKTTKEDMEEAVRRNLGDDEVPKQPNEDKADLQSAVDKQLSLEPFQQEAKDRLEQALDEKNKALGSIKTTFKDSKLLSFPTGNRCFIPVNNYKGTDDINSLRKHLTIVFSSRFKDAKVPIQPSQLLLGIVLRKEYDIVSVEDCVKIGMEGLNIKSREDVLFTVWYLDYFVGTLIFRPDIEDKDGWFKKNIICNPQVVFDSTSASIIESLMELVHSPEASVKYTEADRNDWIKKGLVSVDTLKCCHSNKKEEEKSTSKQQDEEKELIPIEQLVLLLEHSNLLVQIEVKENEHGRETVKTMCFMPIILENATPKELSNFPSPSDSTSTPVKLTFEPQYVPVGLFCGMISRLVSKGREGILGMRWELAGPEELAKRPELKELAESYSVKRNLVIFLVENHIVILVAHVECIEIRVVKKKTRIPLSNLCAYVLSTVVYIMKEINRLICPIIAFDCPCDQHQTEDPHQVCRLSPGVTPSFVCKDTDVLLTPEQQCWFIKEEKKPDSGISMNALQYAKRVDLQGLSFKWSRDGSEIGTGNELSVQKVTEDDCEGYYTCEIFKNGEPFVSVYRCLKAANTTIDKQAAAPSLPNPVDANSQQDDIPDMASTGDQQVVYCSNENQRVSVGERVTLKVQVTGHIDHTLTYQWYKDGNILSNNEVYQGLATDTLVIKKATVKERGGYSCHVYDNKKLPIKGPETKMNVDVVKEFKEKTNLMGQSWWEYLIIGLLIAVILSGCFWWYRNHMEGYDSRDVLKAVFVVLVTVLLGGGGYWYWFGKCTLSGTYTTCDSPFAHPKPKRPKEKAYIPPEQIVSAHNTVRALAAVLLLLFLFVLAPCCLMNCQESTYQTCFLQCLPTSFSRLFDFQQSDTMPDFPAQNVNRIQLRHYHEKDLPGVDVSNQTKLLVTNSETEFDWKGNGLKLFVPQHSLPVDVHSCELHIFLSLSGLYNFPDFNKLVSAVYWIHCNPSCQFTKPITVEVEHCAVKEVTHSLSFVRAASSQGSIPYHFEKLEGQGSFSKANTFGSIQLSSFSGIGITAESSDELTRSHAAALYYLPKRDTSAWTVHLVIIWDLASHLNAVNQYHSDADAQKGAFLSGLCIEGDKILVDISAQVDGWKLVNLTSSFLTRKQVNSYQPGKMIPCIQIRAKHQSTPPAELIYELILDGVKEPNKLTIVIDPGNIITDSNPPDSGNFLHCTMPPFDQGVQTVKETIPDGSSPAQVAVGRLWEHDKLFVYFMNPEDLDKVNLNVLNVMDWTEKWKHEDIPEIEKTDKETKAQIRIKIIPNGVSYSAIGIDATKKDTSEPTMVLGLRKGNNRYNRHVVIHEFGHALGLEHEHQRSKFWSVAENLIDVDKMEKGLGHIVSRDYAPIEQDGRGSKDYDPDSVMHYWFRNDWLKDGIENKPLTDEEKHVLKGIKKMHLKLVQDPSETDLKFLADCYRLPVSERAAQPPTEPVPTITHDSEQEADPFLLQKPTLKQLQLIKYQDSDKVPQRIRPVEIVAPKWRDMGIYLGFTKSKLDIWEKQSQNDKEKAQEVLAHWLDNGSGPGSSEYKLNWIGFLKLCEDLELAEKANEIRTALIAHKQYEAKKT